MSGVGRQESGDRRLFYLFSPLPHTPHPTPHTPLPTPHFPHQCLTIKDLRQCLSFV
ncbi:MAG: hypothetical protein ACK48H_11965 [Microcystis sp.]|uniref:hypothetical protein n=1 Tax=Microcystis sp. TaxID=1127 RepID=UPI00391B3D05